MSKSSDEEKKIFLARVEWLPVTSRSHRRTDITDKCKISIMIYVGIVILIILNAECAYFVILIPSTNPPWIQYCMANLINAEFYTVEKIHYHLYVHLRSIKYAHA